MHDIADLERRGVVGAFVVSAALAEGAQAQARALGVEPEAVVVPHPIQDRTDDELRTIAEQALDAIVRAVTSGG